MTLDMLKNEQKSYKEQMDRRFSGGWGGGGERESARERERSYSTKPCHKKMHSREECT